MSRVEIVINIILLIINIVLGSTVYFISNLKPLSGLIEEIEKRKVVSPKLNLQQLKIKNFKTSFDTISDIIDVFDQQTSQLNFNDLQTKNLGKVGNTKYFYTKATFNFKQNYLALLATLDQIVKQNMAFKINKFNLVSDPQGDPSVFINFTILSYA
jgi:hypothetical protein